MSLLEFLEILDVQLWIFCFQNIFLNGEFFTWPNITLGPYSKPLSSYKMPLVRLESAYACHLEGALVEPHINPAKSRLSTPLRDFPPEKHVTMIMSRKGVPSPGLPFLALLPKEEKKYYRATWFLSTPVQKAAGKSETVLTKFISHTLYIFHN